MWVPKSISCDVDVSTNNDGNVIFDVGENSKSMPEGVNPKV